MLAQNFKAAANLGITEEERTALIGVLGMLERGELQHVSYDEWDSAEASGFNMCDYENPCGTVCCIAGWADKIFKTEFQGASSGPLADLFLMPRHSCRQMGDVTPDQACVAIRNYLGSGEPRWDKVLS